MHSYDCLGVSVKSAQLAVYGLLAGRRKIPCDNALPHPETVKGQNQGLIVLSVRCSFAGPSTTLRHTRHLPAILFWETFTLMQATWQTTWYVSSPSP